MLALIAIIAVLICLGSDTGPGGALLDAVLILTGVMLLGILAFAFGG